MHMSRYKVGTFYGSNSFFQGVTLKERGPISSFTSNEFQKLGSELSGIPSSLTTLEFRVADFE